MQTKIPNLQNQQIIEFDKIKDNDIVQQNVEQNMEAAGNIDIENDQNDSISISKNQVRNKQEQILKRKPKTKEYQHYVLQNELLNDKKVDEQIVNDVKQQESLAFAKPLTNSHASKKASQHDVKFVSELQHSRQPVIQSFIGDKTQVEILEEINSNIVKNNKNDEFQRLVKQTEDQQKQIADLQQQISALQQQNTDLKKNNESIKQNAVQYKNNFEDLQAKLDENNKQLQIANEQLKDQQQQLDENQIVLKSKETFIKDVYRLFKLEENYKKQGFEVQENEDNLNKQVLDTIQQLQHNNQEIHTQLAQKSRQNPHYFEFMKKQIQTVRSTLKRLKDIEIADAKKIIINKKQMFNSCLSKIGNLVLNIHKITELSTTRKVTQQIFRNLKLTADITDVQRFNQIYVKNESTQEKFTQMSVTCQQINNQIKLDKNRLISYNSSCNNIKNYIEQIGNFTQTNCQHLEQYFNQQSDTILKKLQNIDKTQNSLIYKLIDSCSNKNYKLKQLQKEKFECKILEFDMLKFRNLAQQLDKLNGLLQVSMMKVSKAEQDKNQNLEKQKSEQIAKSDQNKQESKQTNDIHLSLDNSTQLSEQVVKIKQSINQFKNILQNNSQQFTCDLNILVLKSGQLQSQFKQKSEQCSKLLAFIKTIHVNLIQIAKIDQSATIRQCLDAIAKK